MLAAGALDGSVTLLDCPFPSTDEPPSAVFGGDVVEHESVIGLENTLNEARFQAPQRSIGAG